MPEKTIKIHDRDCTGCYACQNICPTESIQLKEDNEGFKYPVIDVSKCIKCGKCKSVCAIELHRQKRNYNPIAFACSLKDKHEQKKSVTAGVAFSIGKNIIDNNGVVYGVAGSMVNGVYHMRCDTIDQLEMTRSSKYLQSNIGYCYKRALEDLQSGKSVLFTGTPCQIAGLYNFLGHQEWDNLITVDLICHGVPSAKAFRMYITETEKKAEKKVVSFYRDKTQGWAPTYFTTIFDDGQQITNIGTKDSFNHGFTTNILTRKSCQKCQYAKIPRVADITVGDFLDKSTRKELDPKNEGLSLVTINSSKGEEIWYEISDLVNAVEFKIDDVVKSSEHLGNSPHYNVFRRSFFYLLNKTKSFEKAIKINEPNSFVRMLRRIYGLFCIISECIYKDGLFRHRG